MVTDQQVRKLMTLKKKGKTLLLSAAKAGMDEKTARKYLRRGKLPSESRSPHLWRTRPDPFEEVWDLADRLRLLRVHGGRQMYHHRWVGWNSRLDALQAAVAPG